MNLLSNRIFLIIIGFLFLITLAYKSVKAAKLYNLYDTDRILETDSINGYSDVVLFKGRFFAVGTDGRIDYISNSGEKKLVYNSFKLKQIKLNCAFSDENILIAAGDHGTILYSFDGKDFYPAKSETDNNIYGITSKDGIIMAGSDGGALLTSKNGKSWSIIQTEAKGKILSLSANNSFFIGVSDAGEIIKSSDGIKWEIKDYNKEYTGYNRYTKFRKILAIQKSVIIIGTHDDGSPSILFSSLGNVWAERLPVYHDDHGMECYLTNKPNDVTYNSNRDEFIIACDKGELFILPSCTKCNEYIKISENDLNAIIYADNYLFIVGEGFSTFIQNVIFQ